MGVNDVFTVGDFPITVKEANGSNGVYSGWGYVTYPFLGNSRIKVVFNNVSMQITVRRKQLAESSMQVILKKGTNP